SITNGTFAAVALSTVVYLIVMVLLAGAVPAPRLVSETNTIIGDLSWQSWTMLVGVLAATISSALASTLGSPRVLQRLGEDRVLPGLDRFAVGAGRSNNPRRALGISLIIALGTVAIGDLNTIAPIISMFFLATYGIINYATYYEFRAGSTAFRPTFKYGGHRTSLAGTLACVGVIVAINPVAGAFAAMIFVGLYGYLRRRDVPDRWIDSAGSYHYTRARQHLQAHAAEPVAARDWRPCALAFVPRDPATRRRMLTMASWLEGDSGFVTAVRLIEGRGPIRRREAAAIERDLSAEADEIAPGTFAKALVVADAEVGVQTLVQSHGIGKIRTNLTLFGVQDLRESADEGRLYGQMLQNCVRFGTNVAVLNVRPDAWDRFEQTPRNQRSIALWWSDDQVGQLITLLAWLCARDRSWSEASIVAYVPGDESDADLEGIRLLLKKGRINAEVKRADPTPASLTTALGAATLALAPLRVRRGHAIGPHETPLGMLVESLPLAIMVLATEEVSLDADPAKSTLAEIARLSDLLAKHERTAAALDTEAGRLLVDAEAARLTAEAAPQDANLAHRAKVANERSVAAFRKYVKARTECRNLADELAALHPSSAASELDPEIWRSSSARR
ncbi:MAG: amino acid permease, partial [Acidimicrobiales bacterium]